MHTANAHIDIVLKIGVDSKSYNFETDYLPPYVNEVGCYSLMIHIRDAVIGIGAGYWLGGVIDFSFNLFTGRNGISFDTTEEELELGGAESL